MVTEQTDVDRFQREDLVAAVQLGDYQHIVHHGGDVVAVRIDDFAEFFFLFRVYTVAGDQFGKAIDRI